MEIFILSINLLGGLGVFLYGLKVMSEGLQKVAGSRLRELLNKATSNRVSAVLTGFLVTCAVQSSSASTVMVVGFCSAGILSLYQALGIIFGANIGTTTTGWIVSLLGFKVSIAKFALPLIGIGFFSQFIRRWRMPHRIGEVFVGFGLLFLGLSLIKKLIPNLKQSPQVMEILSRLEGTGLETLLLAVLVGAVLTVIFQSSSATMAVTLTAAASGLIDYRTASALVLGENIGTTITANLAAIGAPLTARRAARGHFFFNITGTIWMLILFNPFLMLVDFIVPGDPYGNSQNSLLIAIPTHIAAFHSLFNILNTSIMLPLLRPMERFIRWIVPDKEGEDQPALRYIATPLSQTPELSLELARKEVDHMADVILGMLKRISNVIMNGNKEMRKDIDRILKDEKKTDALENDINTYLSDLAHAHLSTASNKEVHSLMSMINDLERMGDHGEKLANILDRLREQKSKLSEQSVKELQIMATKTIDIVQSMKNSILEREGDPMPKAREREEELNRLRYQYRDAHYERMTKEKSAANIGILFMDILTSFEKMGDHAFNVIEASAGIK